MLFEMTPVSVFVFMYIYALMKAYIKTKIDFFFHLFKNVRVLDHLWHWYNVCITMHPRKKKKNRPKNALMIYKRI